MYDQRTRIAPTPVENLAASARKPGTIRRAINGRLPTEQAGTLPAVRHLTQSTNTNASQPENAKQRRHEARKAAAISRNAAEMTARRNAGRIVLGRGRAGTVSKHTTNN